MDNIIYKIKNWFNGKKTIFGIIAGSIYSVLIYYGIAPSNDMVWLAIATWTGIAFKTGINKIQTKPVDNPPVETTIPQPTKYIPPTPIVEPPETLAG